MRYSVSDEGFTSKDRSDYQRQIKPNTYLVIHLETYVQSPRFGDQWGSPEIYDQEAYKLIANISKEVLGTTAYRKRPRNRKRLPNMVTLEYHGGSPHLNICIKRPEGWTLDEFREVVRRHCEVSDWFRTTGRAFYCEERTGNCGSYSLKSGATILTRSLSFFS